MNIFISIYLILIISVSSNAYSQIPVTTTSKEALNLYAKGFELEDKGELAFAREHYKKAIENDTSFALAYMALALLQSEYAERKKLMAQSVSLIQKVSEGERLWILGRNAFYGDGKREEELSFFEKLVALHPEDATAQYLVGYMNHHHGRNNIEKAIEHLQKAIQINPRYITAINDLGNTYMDAKDFANAEQIFLQLIKLLPNKAKPVDRYAEMLMRSGQFERSIGMYKEALRIDPAYPWSYFGMAASLNFLGRHNEARSILPQVSFLKLSERETYHVMHAYVCSFIDEGKTDSALLVLHQQSLLAKEKNYFTQRYIALDNVTRIWFEYGNAIKGMQAYAIFNNMIQSEGKNADLKKQVQDLGSYYKAYASYINNHYSQASVELQEYDSLRGSVNEQSKLLLAKILIKDGKEGKAVSLLEKSNADNPYIQFWLATAYERDGEIKKAQTLYRDIANRNEMQELDYHLVRRKAIEKLMKNN